jgi:hypothetical protein
MVYDDVNLCVDGAEQQAVLQAALEDSLAELRSASSDRQAVLQAALEDSLAELRSASSDRVEAERQERSGLFAQLLHQRVRGARFRAEYLFRDREC